ncbi:MAG TPA: nuclear transport factor 2 family protein [Acidimicrobiales bacterium]|nr:nuclear transport factor 2 family protein [Acidimicrobiales bacterium]
MDDEARIREVLARFIQLRDDKRFAEWTELFTEDGTFEYLSHILVGRTAIGENVAALLRQDRGKHLCANSVVEVADDGRSAEVRSDFVKLDPVEDPGSSRFQIGVMGQYHDHFVREGGGWKIAKRRVIL